MIGLVAGLGLIALSPIIRETAFDLIGGSADIRQHGETYFNYRIWSAPAALSNYCVMGWFIGQSKAKLAFMVQLFLNLTNMALSATFVLHLGMTSDGVGLAALIAEWSGRHARAVPRLHDAARHGREADACPRFRRQGAHPHAGDERRRDDPHALPRLRLHMVHGAWREGGRRGGGQCRAAQSVRGVGLSDRRLSPMPPRRSSGQSVGARRTASASAPPSGSPASGPWWWVWAVH
jgi:hypothetical protein